MRKRVVVTGLGVVSSAGCNKINLWDNVLKGISCVKKTEFHEDYGKLPSEVAAIISKTEFAKLLEINGITGAKLRKMSKSTCLAILAAKEAISDSKLNECDLKLKENIGVAIGSGMTDFTDICETENSFRKSYHHINPHFIPRILLNMATANISLEYNFQGPNHCVSTACASGLHSIGDSYKLIRNGNALAMICGGTEACVNPLTVAGFSRLRALSTNFNSVPQKASRPFDDQRDGFVIGEGAAVLVLEELNHALERNAIIYAEILGYGMSGDAFNLTAPHPSGKGAILAMNRAIKDSISLTAKDISYVNAHATSTLIGDNIELMAVGEVFKDCDELIYISSTKGCHGHLLGAAGSIETLCTVLACYYSVIPPTANLENCSPHNSNLECNSTEHVWNKYLRIALKNSFGFGGTNASLCISNYIH
ncbi:hypothetical protein PGB90_003995 [Kerria lacca]